MRRLSSALLPLWAAPLVLGAQGRTVELRAGRWYNGNRSFSYELRTMNAIEGIAQGLTATALVSDTLGRRRAFYGAGYELQALRGRAGFGSYVVLGAALGLSTDTSKQQIGVLWSVGTGIEWRPVSWAGVGVEGRYRLEDRGPRGFWNAASDARRGVSVAVGVAIGGGRRARGGGRSGRRAPVPPLPPPEPPATVTGNAADVVQTALDVLGTPYQWGGTAENGFDCSGLIQYAYGQHGIRLARRGQEQATEGGEITPVVEALRPGDILLFSARPNAGVTHVGMYVGEEKFIHSAATGVKLSRLDPHDPDGAYWMARWVGARRVMP